MKARCKLLAIALLSLALPLRAATRRVPTDHPTVQAALDAAGDGDTVLVGPGEYVITEPITFRGKAVTLRSEGGAEATTIRMAVTPANEDRASVVIFESGETEATVLEGFTLTGGKGTEWGEWLERNGGGVFCVGGSSPRIADCTIAGNAADLGGGLCCRAGSSPKVSNCTLSGNSSFGGGVIFCFENSSPRLTDCTISGNSDEGGAGVFCMASSSPMLTGCTLSGNSCSGVFCREGSSPTLTDCTIAGNSTGGLPALFCHDNSSPALTGCTISGNSLGGGVAVSCQESSSPTLTHCTISGNWSYYGGGMYCSGGSSPTLESCILWDNSGDSITAEADSLPQVRFSCIEGDESWPGEGNINLAPGFCGFPAAEAWVADQDGFAAALGGFSFALSSASPCLGAGAGGSDMGSKARGCDAPGDAGLLVHLAAGTYQIFGFHLAQGVSLEGAGEESTTIEGTVCGLRTGAILSRLMVTAGLEGGGILIPRGEAPEISTCTISGSSGFGVRCGESSSPTLRNCTISGSRGTGVSCEWFSSPMLLNCTISGSRGFSGSPEDSGAGVYCFSESSVMIESCIVWGNQGGSILQDGAPQVSFSCIEGEEVWPGEGNINLDPRFCGFPAAEAWVADQEGFAAALGGFSLDLSGGSPCIGAGAGGSEMGSKLRGCDAPSTLLVHLAEGTYQMSGFHLAQGVSLEGAGEKSTTIEGTVHGLRTGAVLSHLTVTGGLEGGILVSGGQAPEISHCTILGNSGGVSCEARSSPSLRNCTISGNQYHGVSCGGEGASPTLTGCRISANLGPGLSASAWSSPTLMSCTISGNSGPGVSSWYHALPALRNCTISGNIGSGSAGGVYSGNDGSVALESCIVWDNPGGSIATEGGGAVEARFSCIEGEEVWPGEGNINLDPRFCGFPAAEASVADQEGFAAALGAYSLDLSSGSPCLGAGAGGSDMGSGSRACDAPGEARLLLRLAAGVYGICGLSLAHGVSLEGAGEESTTIEGTVHGLRTGTVLSRLAVRIDPEGGDGTFPQDGIVVRAGQAPEISSCAISAPWSNGSGVDCRNSSPTLRACSISGDWSIGGVSCWNDSSPTLTGCTISTMSCMFGSSPKLTGCALSGVDCMFDSSPILMDCSIGGLSCMGSSPALTNCAISGQWGSGAPRYGSGSGVWCSGSSPSLTDCSISGCSASGNGGGMCCQDGSSPKLTNCTISGNSAGGSGGGVYCSASSSPSFTNCTIAGNSAGGDGGGVCYYDSRFPGTLSNCTIYGNSAGGSGGGVYCGEYSSPELTNCILSSNSSQNGGGLSCVNSGPTLTNCTVTGNRALADGGLSCTQSSFLDPKASLTNCIVWGNTPESICGGVSHCLADEDPLFVKNGQFDFERWTAVVIGGTEVRLPDFIVEEPDYHLLPGSPAIDAGTPEGASPADIEGTPRPQGDGVDIGAYEFSVPGGLQRPGDSNQDAQLDLSDAVWLLGHLFLGTEPELPCEGGTAAFSGPGELALLDINGDEQIDLSDAVSLLSFLFLGGKPPALGTDCIRIPGCPDRCR